MNVQSRGVFSLIKARADVFYHSTSYMVIVAVVAMLGLVFEYEVAAIFVLAALALGSWLLVEDILPSFLIVTVIGLIGLRIPREGMYHFTPLYYTPIVMVPGFIIKMFIHPFKFIKGTFFYPTLAVAVAIVLGGLFVISFEAYFAFRTLYYTFFLGPGMVFIYFVLERYVEKREDIADYFAKMMVAVGVVGFFMLFSSYYMRFGGLDDFELGRFFQWRNNLSNNLLMSMPFAFYLAYKARWSGFYIMVGTLQFVALVFSFSRGGIIFGLLAYPLTVLATLIVAKGHRLKIFTIVVIITGLMYYFFEEWVIPVSEIIADLRARVTVSSDEARANLYRMAWENFKTYPVFGTGLGFDVSDHYNPKTMSMHWYHSTFFQIIGSLGIVGLIAYTYQGIVRTYSLIKVRHVFNLFVALSMLGFGGYQMVNVGYFAPLPFVAMVVTMFVVVDRNNAVQLDKIKDAV